MTVYKTQKAKQLVWSGIFIFALWTVYSLLGSIYLPSGINSTFTSTNAKLWFAALLVAFAALFIVVWVYERKSFEHKKIIESVEFSDALLLLLPMSPIMQYIISNRDVLSFVSAFHLFLFFFCLAALFCLVIPWLLSVVVPRRTMSAAALAFIFVLFQMSSLASDFSWHGRGDFGIQLGLMLGVFIFSLALWRLGQRSLHIVCATYFFAGLVISLPGAAFPEVEENGQDISSQPYEAVTFKKRPNVYLLIYDSYSNQETMKFYGFDNSEQLEYLNSQGFEIYNGVYSTGSSSIESMSRVLAMNNVPPPPSGEKWHGRHYTAGNAGVHSTFRSNGYQTIGIFTDSYFFQNSSIGYDAHFPQHSIETQTYSVMRRSILEGEFRFDTMFDNVDYDAYIAAKRSVFASGNDASKFLYTHTHWPGHSQNSGKCLPDETDKYVANVKKANMEMRDDLAVLLKHDPQAVVVIAGDHGPYLTANCFKIPLEDADKVTRMDIQDRVGTFLAIRWPTPASSAQYDIQILQDVFPAILSYLSEDDRFIELRPDRETDGYATAGVKVIEGIIQGGLDAGGKLFLE